MGVFWKNLPDCISFFKFHVDTAKISLSSSLLAMISDIVIPLILKKMKTKLKIICPGKLNIFKDKGLI